MLRFHRWIELGLSFSCLKSKDITELIASGLEEFASVLSCVGAAIAVLAPLIGAAAVSNIAEATKGEKVDEKEAIR